MSDQLREQDLPGIGRRNSVQAEGGEVSGLTVLARGEFWLIAGPLAASRSHRLARQLPGPLFPTPALSRKDSP